MTESRQSDSWWDARWDTTIERNGIWPFRWSWSVAYTCHRDSEYHSRFGDALSKDRAQRKAAAARLSIERDDLSIREVTTEALP